MKTLLSYFTIMMLAAMVLTSCGKKQAETQTDVPLKVTYSIDFSTDLLNLCDVVITYKGDDGADVVDTVTIDPENPAMIQTWSKEVATHKVPVKIGFDYTLVQKTDTLVIDHPTAMLKAKYAIIADEIGMVNRRRIMSDKVINSKRSFYVDGFMMDEEIINTRRNLATIIDVYNDRLAHSRETEISNTCFIVKPHPNGKGLKVVKVCWNDGATE